MQECRERGREEGEVRPKSTPAWVFPELSAVTPQPSLSGRPDFLPALSRNTSASFPAPTQGRRCACARLPPSRACALGAERAWGSHALPRDPLPRPAPPPRLSRNRSLLPAPSGCRLYLGRPRGQLVTLGAAFWPPRCVRVSAEKQH